MSSDAWPTPSDVSLQALSSRREGLAGSASISRRSVFSGGFIPFADLGLGLWCLLTLSCDTCAVISQRGSLKRDVTSDELNSEGSNAQKHRSRVPASSKGSRFVLIAIQSRRRESVAPRVTRVCPVEPSFLTYPSHTNDDLSQPQDGRHSISIRPGVRTAHRGVPWANPRAPDKHRSPENTKLNCRALFKSSVLMVRWKSRRKRSKLWKHHDVGLCTSPAKVQ